MILEDEIVYRNFQELYNKCAVNSFAIVDTEVGVEDMKIHDIGAIRYDGAVFHAANKPELYDFLKDVKFLCGHNIINHDARYLFGDDNAGFIFVDTLFVSPLLFPEKPFHHLLKDDKLLREQLNNPVNDCVKAYDLLNDEVDKWEKLSSKIKDIFATLLHDFTEFGGFLSFVNANIVSKEYLIYSIRLEYEGKICDNADFENIINDSPRELAYALALIDTTDYRSVTPEWVLHNYPNVENIVYLLRSRRCSEGCVYCNDNFDLHNNLQKYFGYSEFRTYDGEPLQENAVRAAVDGDSLLAIFPTGGGKSLTFQLPALMAGHSVHGLTVVISPLQSLMKDQVENLADRGITSAVTINGLLDPISRSEAINRVMNGDASLLYIAPEMLRSNTMTKILFARHIVRFVIDEAHCFSSWGQDFRVDYLYIGKFIKQYREKKNLNKPIPVSCFTATAKQKVIQDICDYFKQTLDIDLKLFASSASRTNLHYSVIHAESDEEKYLKLRSLIVSSSCPTIVYVSRTRRTKELADKLTKDGYSALPFNGRMDADEKIANQDAFMNDNVRIIVATSAFGMGVDKKDVGLVVHYDISDSLENYIQEAGRAGRDPQLKARCYVLYCDADLDKHFILLNQTKLSISEIQQVWKAVKELTRFYNRVCCSALEIARQAGWDDSVYDIETRVRTALAALEQAGYIERGNNVPHVYATGITVKNMDEARARIMKSKLFDGKEIEKAARIIKSLISQKYLTKEQDSDAESRVDYLADILGLTKNDVISNVERMRQEGILADSKDISAFINAGGESENKSKKLLNRFTILENYILNTIQDNSICSSYKQLNDNAIRDGINTAIEKDIRSLFYFLTIRGYIRKIENISRNVEVTFLMDVDKVKKRFELRKEICLFIIEWLYKLAPDKQNENKRNFVHFSIVQLLNDLKHNSQDLYNTFNEVDLSDVEEALLYLSKIGALKLEGGFLVLYNAMDICRIEDSKSRYKKEDYRILNEFYKQKIQQIHIVGEYANLMVHDYDAALRFVQDYFQMDYKKFISKYFKADRVQQIERNITPAKYSQLFDGLSDKQMEIISDNESRCIVVAAGPGSGKTKVLVHKLASLLLLEDVKHEQLLMLTFSRASAIEFKRRLMFLIGNAAHYVEIKTFHSYCFDLLGKIGNLDDAVDVIGCASRMIRNGEVEPNRIFKTVLVIDEAQDMSEQEYELVSALMAANEDMRVIAVGDDDQNIFEFRGSDSRHMARLYKDTNARLVEMTDNFRSSRHVVNLANILVGGLRNRMKKTPIVSRKNEDGFVSITHHTSDMMYMPVVEEVVANKGRGTICILTQTNEEAVIIVALLRKYRLSCNLIQSMDSFRFWNMAEIRLFLKYIDSGSHSPVISDKVWEYAKDKTFAMYADSDSLQYLQRCIKLFEETNREKYVTDFKEYIFESSVEDFCDISGSDVVVSTIHKAKGLEFDDVYMLVKEPDNITAEILRRYYVGVTRAKSRLFIHTNSSIFDNMPSDRFLSCKMKYEMPNEVVLQLSLKDVILDFFKSRKKEILSLRAGGPLRFDNNYLYIPDTNIAVAKLSKKMQEELLEWMQRGYSVTSANIRFVVAWRPKDAQKTDQEYAVLLVELTITRL